MLASKTDESESRWRFEYRDMCLSQNFVTPTWVVNTRQDKNPLVNLASVAFFFDPY